MSLFRKTLSCAFIAALSSGAQAKSRSSAARAKPAAAPVVDSTERVLERVERAYRQGSLSDTKAWLALDTLAMHLNSLPAHSRGELLQLQAHLLGRSGYPILSGIYASKAVLQAEKPDDPALARSWQILANVAKTRPIQNLLELMAGGMVALNQTPSFGTDWQYFVGNAAASDGQNEKALAAYQKVRINDRYFLAAKYEEAMIDIDLNRLSEAETALKAVLNSASLSQSPLRGAVRREMVNYAEMALARIYYEQRDFLDAIKLYRAVDRDSPLFYDALFEQAWAFFMGGYPNHALGAIYSVESPFFSDHFNPEASMLRAIAYYWMCRYDDSRAALADFMEKHSDAVQSLGTFLDRQHLSDETAYQLFENVVSGVSSEALGIPRSILVSAANKDSMMLVRDQYASILEERERLADRGVFGLKRGVEKPTEYLDRWADSLRKDLGAKYLRELRGMKSDYDRLYSQAQFLYLELLMSEKEKLLGRELHANSKITHVSMKQEVAGWGKGSQSWGPSDKQEYWWDEIGYYISSVSPMCRTN